MLYGPPGGGKTAFIKALAHYTGRHIIVFPISSQTNLTSIQEIMRQEVIEDTYGIPHEKRIYVFEEFHLIGDAQLDRHYEDGTSSTTGSCSSSTSVVKPTDGMEALDKLKIKAKEIYEEENAENAENVEKEKNAKKKKKKKKKKSTLR
eukprot:Trichotokara_eunicae@DN2502_c0_g1_i4.p1